MKINDLVNMYEGYRQKYGTNAYKKISSLLSEAKELHYKDFINSSTAKKALAEGRQPDHEQSWRAFKGKNLEKLVAHIIKEEIESLGLRIVNGNNLERTSEVKLSTELSAVKRNLLVDYGEFGEHLPDLDK